MSYESLLELALTSHNPFRAAFKEQYASLVLTHDADQLAIARAVAARMEAARGQKLATRIDPLREFTNAEDYHQKYHLRNDRTLMVDFHAMFGSDDDAFRESSAAARVNGYVAGDGSRMQLEREIAELGLSDSGAKELLRRFGMRGTGIGCAI